MRALASGLQTCLPGLLQAAARQAQIGAVGEIESDQERAETNDAVPSTSGLQQRTGAIPKNPRFPSQRLPAVTTRAMSKKLEFWSIDNESVDDQQPVAAEQPVERDFEGFDQEREVLASTPLRNLRATLNRTMLDPSSDGSDDDWDELIRNVTSDEPTYLEKSDRFQPRSTTSEPGSKEASNRDFYYLTMSDRVIDDLPSLSGPCLADCWCKAEVSPATAGSSPRFSFGESLESL